jgi:acetyl coenzyme A synthetase (ADP forming)-like protein
MTAEKPEDRELLTEEQGYRLLARYGIPAPRHALVHDLSEALDVAERIGYPVVLKVVSSDIVHKSDAGGVLGHITSPAGLKGSMARMNASVQEKAPSAEIQGYMIEEELPPGLELFIGGKTDPAFGRVLSFGLGGTAVELYRDVSLRILPVSGEDIRVMIREIRGYPLIAGYRGKPSLDEQALTACIENTIRLFESDEGVVEFDINPLILYEKGACAVDARIYRSVVREQETPPRRELDPSLFRPQSIAVIGASGNPEKIGYAVFRNLLPFPGSLYPVNPGHAEILGKPVFARVADIPGTVDVAVIAVPALLVPGIIEELAEHGTPLAIIISSGFREIGREGEELEKKILATARKSGMRIIGPNCLGIVLPHQNINTTFDPVAPRKGHIAFISQSGAIITTIVDWSVPEEIGFSAVISVGNQLDLGFIDFLRYAGLQDETRAVILYIEEIKDGRAFLDVVKEITRIKPVIVLKSGSSAIGKKAASSHTGSLAGDFEVYLTAFRQAGAIPVFSIREAFDVAELLVSEGYPQGNRALVITAAGGFAVLASDYAERFGIDLPPLSPQLTAELDLFLPPIWNRGNPMDIIGDGGAERYARVFDILTRFQDEWDIALVIAVPSAVIDPAHLAQEIARFSKNTHKMTVGCLVGGDSMKRGMRILRHNHIPNYEDIESAFLAVGRTLSARGLRKRESDLKAQSSPSEREQKFV